MKKITIIFLLICGYTYSQNLVIESGASLTIEKTGSATVGGNFSNSGTVTMNSDADEFSAIKISGTANGNITYNRFVNYAASGEWDLIGSPVDGLSISAFINTNTSGTATLATNGSAFAVGYYDNSTDTWTNYTTGTVGGAGNFDIGNMWTFGYWNYLGIWILEIFVDLDIGNIWRFGDFCRQLLSTNTCFHQSNLS